MKPDAYFICATPRSGSTLLCDLLYATGMSGRPNSFYRRESIPDYVKYLDVPPDPEGFDQAYLSAILRHGTAGTGMFGLRQMWDHKAEMVLALRRLFPDLPDDLARFRAAFGDVKYIYLSRTDKVAQAVSRAKAEQSGLWHKYADGSVREQFDRFQEPVYNPELIRELLDEAEHDGQQWEDWFRYHNIEPLRVTYENLAADPQAALDRILQAFDVAPAKAVIKSQKLAGKENSDWIMRFRSEAT